MDIATHGAITVLALRSCATEKLNKSFLWVAAAAAAFPDSDYLLFWVDPYAFITEWHRGWTHSLVLLPCWAAILSLLFYQLSNKRIPFSRLYSLSCLGLFSHILADLITVYGVQLFAPFSKQRYALGVLFDLELGLLMLSLIAILPAWRHRRFARYAMLLLLLYVVNAVFLQHQAAHHLHASMRQSSAPVIKGHVLPQPYLPWHWVLVIERKNNYEVAHLSFAKQLSTQIAGYIQAVTTKLDKLGATMPQTVVSPLPYITFSDYHNPSALAWQSIAKFGVHKDDLALSNAVWQQPEFSAFRSFSQLPVLYRIDRHSTSTCVWYTDLRYLIPMQQPVFRYGMCQASQASEWTLYRLLRNTYNRKQQLRNASADSSFK